MTPEELILNAIAQSQSQITGMTSGGQAGSTISIRTNTQTFSATCYVPVPPGQCAAFLAGGQWYAVGSGVAQQLRSRSVEFARRRELELVQSELVPYYIALFAVYSDTSGNLYGTRSAIAFWAWDGTTLTKVFETFNNLDPIPNIEYLGLTNAIRRDVSEQLLNFLDSLDSYHFIHLAKDSSVYQFMSRDLRIGSDGSASGEGQYINTALYSGLDTLLQQHQIDYRQYPHRVDASGRMSCSLDDFYPQNYSGLINTYSNKLSSHYGLQAPSGSGAAFDNSGICDTQVVWEYNLGRDNFLDEIPWVTVFNDRGVAIPPQPRGHLNIANDNFYTWLTQPDPQGVELGFSYDIAKAMAGATYTYNRMNPTTGEIETGEVVTTAVPYLQFEVPFHGGNLQEWSVSGPGIKIGSTFTLEQLANGTADPANSFAYWGYIDTTLGVGNNTTYGTRIIHIGTKVVLGPP